MNDPMVLTVNENAARMLRQWDGEMTLRQFDPTESIVTFVSPTGETVNFPVLRAVRLSDVEAAARENLS